MAVKKATTTDDLKQVEDGVSASPTPEDLVARIEEHSDPEMVADVKAPKYTKVKSPAGYESTVPDSILDSLLESGYTKSK